MSKNKCEHLRVLIRAIETLWSKQNKRRTLRGICQDCFKEVRRLQNQREIETGRAETNWR